MASVLFRSNIRERSLLVLFFFLFCLVYDEDQESSDRDGTNNIGDFLEIDDGRESNDGQESDDNRQSDDDGESDKD